MSHANNGIFISFYTNIERNVMQFVGVNDNHRQMNWWQVATKQGTRENLNGRQTSAVLPRSECESIVRSMRSQAA